MKTRFINYYLIAILSLGACTVPDFHQLNPQPLKDAPAFNVTPGGTSQVTVNNVTYVIYGQSADFNIGVTDAPGKVSDLGGVIAIPSYGTVTVDQASLATLKGQEQGTGKVTFNAMAAPDGTDRSVSFDISVTDSQINEKGESAAKSTKVTRAVTLVPCISEGIAAGTYRVTAASGILDGGAAYTLTSLQTDHGGPVNVTITKVRPGLYTFNEVTGGIWPTYYSTRANPALSVNLCGTTVNGHEGAVTTGVGSTAQRKFTINGTLNVDGTISITWSYVRETGAPPAIPANGTYTLTKI